MVGLVLEGGAMRGMYTAGVLDVFLDNDINIDAIIGVSAGALFGVNYVSKQRGRAIRYNKKYIRDKRYIGLRSLRKTGNVVNRDFAYYEVPMKLDVFDDELFKKRKIPFYAVVTNVETGLAEYMKIDSVFEQMEELRASSAMPFVSKMVLINGKKYLDGGIADSIPYQYLRDLGYDKLIVVLTRDYNYRKKPMNKHLIKHFYKDYPNLMECLNNRHNIYNETVSKLINEDKDIFVIRPSEPIKIKRIEKDVRKLDEVYNLGIKDCSLCIEEIKKIIA